MLDSDHYIHVLVQDSAELHIALTEYERFLHHVEQKTDRLIEFVGRYGQTVALIPAHVKLYIVWNEKAVTKFKADEAKNSYE